MTVRDQRVSRDIPPGLAASCSFAVAWRTNGFAIALVLSLSTAACAGETLEFAGWTLPVAEGTEVHEYAPVPLSERSERIGLVEDLVIGERGDDDNYRLYDAAGAKVDAEGSFYVLDGGNFRIQVFDHNGEYVRTFGGQGQGPGEFTRPRGLVLAGDRVVVVDSGNRRFSSWTLDGEPLADIGIETRYAPSGMFGFDDGTFLGSALARREEASDEPANLGPRTDLLMFGTDFKELATIQEFPPLELPEFLRQTETTAYGMRVMLPASVPSHTAARTGETYTSFCEEYQVLAYAHDGAPRWALRVAWERMPVTEEEIAKAFGRVRETLPDARRTELSGVPEHKPALSYVTVDGHGHLYVYPYLEDLQAVERPVDVYSSDGEHLFSGWIPAVRWSDARGDFVYGRESDDDTGEERIIRYRLVEPF